MSEQPMRRTLRQLGLQDLQTVQHTAGMYNRVDAETRLRSMCRPARCNDLMAEGLRAAILEESRCNRSLESITLLFGVAAEAAGGIRLGKTG